MNSSVPRPLTPVCDDKTLSGKAAQYFGVSETRQVIRTESNKEMSDMCCIQRNGEQLVVTVHKLDGIYAYNLRTGDLEWTVKNKLPGWKFHLDASGVTTDGRSHLFVSDVGNRCVHVFCVDGKYVGPVIQHGERGFPARGRLHFMRNLSSLAITAKEEQWNTRVVKVEGIL